MFNIFSGEKPFLPWDTLSALFAAKNPSGDNPVATLADALPPGVIFYAASSTAPPGSVKANGAALGRVAYARLFAQIGTAFGAGDGSTTFCVPDLRGEFLRGWDDGRGVDSGRVFGSEQWDAIRDIQGTMIDMQYMSNNILQPTGVFSIGIVNETGKAYNFYAHNGWTLRSGYSFAASNFGVPTAAENRPRNVALLVCIKY